MPFWRAHVWLFAVPLDNETYFRLTPQQVAFGEDYFYHLSVIRSKIRFTLIYLVAFLLNIVVF